MKNREVKGLGLGKLKPGWLQTSEGGRKESGEKEGKRHVRQGFVSNGDEPGIYSEATESHWMWFKEKVMLPFASSVTLDVGWTCSYSCHYVLLWWWYCGLFFFCFVVVF